jgi:transcription initiation factor TFIIIB Brf1 subunit/transcription initiation factor TFIIB
VLDHHAGNYVCCDCGLIKDTEFIYSYKSTYTKEKNESSTTSLIHNILDKFDFSDYYSSGISANMNHSSSKNLKKVTSEIYKEVNKNISSLPLKSLMNISGLSPKHIKSEKIHIMQVEELIEKYVKIFGFNRTAYTVIKEKIKQSKHNGFQPLSIIGGLIYLHSIDIKKKLSMKIIASHLGISPISIQRFIKHEFSSRT